MQVDTGMTDANGAARLIQAQRRRRLASERCRWIQHQRKPAVQSGAAAAVQAAFRGRWERQLLTAEMILESAIVETMDVVALDSSVDPGRRFARATARCAGLRCTVPPPSTESVGLQCCLPWTSHSAGLPLTWDVLERWESESASSARADAAFDTTVRAGLEAMLQRALDAAFAARARGEGQGDFIGLLARRLLAEAGEPRPEGALPTQSVAMTQCCMPWRHAPPDDPSHAGGRERSSSPSAGRSPSAKRWRKARLIASASSAFRSAGHARRHAIDEADREREGLTKAVPSGVLGAGTSRWRATVRPFVLQMKVAMAFREATAASTEKRSTAVALPATEADVALALEAAKWLVASSMVKQLKASQLDDEAEAVSTPTPPPSVASASKEAREAATAAAAPWCAAVLEAKGVVLDPNVPGMEAHLQGMWSENVGSATRQLKQSGLSWRTVMKGKAQNVHRTLRAAGDELQRQLVAHMVHFVSQRISGLSERQLSSLCLSCISTFRATFDRPWSIEAIEAELEARCPCPPELRSLMKPAADAGEGGAGAGEGGAGADESGGAIRSPGMANVLGGLNKRAGYLLRLVLGDASALPGGDATGSEDGDGSVVGVSGFVTTFAATYLDPFIDGNLSPAEVREMYTGGLMSRLQRAWAEARGGGVRLPVGAEGVIGIYCRHAITKMNSWRGFGQHVPGLGRLPAQSGEQANHCRRLGQALVEALGRDFSDIPRPAADDGEDDVGGSGEAVPLRGLEASEVEAVAALHLRAMYAYDGVLNEALAAANREGEANQMEERRRIFGLE